MCGVKKEVPSARSPPNSPNADPLDTRVAYMPAGTAAKVRQKSRRRSKSQGWGSELKPNLSIPLPPGGGLPFVLAEQASTLLGDATDFFFGEASKGAGASTATPDPSVSSSVATEERSSVAGETSQAASSPGTFPRNETERRVFDRCRDTYLSRGLPLPHDMLFGFVRTNSKEYTAADEVRWGDSALALLDEALQLFHEAKVDRNVQRLLPADEEAGRARAIFDECWPYVELGQDCTGHWTVLDRLGSADFDRLHRELGNDQADLPICLSVYLPISPLPSLSPTPQPSVHPSTCPSPSPSTRCCSATRSAWSACGRVSSSWPRPSARPATITPPSSTCAASTRPSLSTAA